MEEVLKTLLTPLIAIFVFTGCSGDGDSNSNPDDLTGKDNPAEVLEIAFGVYTSDKPTDVVKEFRPALNALEVALGESLGKTVKISTSVSSSYEGGIAEIATGKVQLSRLGPASYVTAKQSNSNLVLLAMEGKKGAKVFNGIICVQQDSEVKSLAELKGKRFAFGDELSTIGRFLSQEQLRKAGVLARDLGSYEYLGRHDAVGAAVGSGKFDAGALKESSFKKRVESGSPIKELLSFPNVTKPWIAHPSVDKDVLAALKKALLDMTDEAALDALGIDQLLEAEDADFAPTRESMKNNPLFFAEK